jgi:CRP/FNR family cyclic AMP-dependent transcriptional regulator
MEHTPLVIDLSTVSVIDKGLADDDPAVVVFATSLLEHLPLEEALPRLTAALGHEVPEVRAEAARVFGRLDAPLDFGSGVSFARRLAEEEVPFVVAALLETIGRMGGVEPERVERYLEHHDPEVRRAALVALGRLGWPDADNRIRQLFAESEVASRMLAAAAVGDLGATHLLEELAGTIEDPEVRPAALSSLVQLGADAVPVMTRLLDRRDLPLPLRRSIVTALGAVEGQVATEALIGLLDEPALGPAALTSLSRLRASDRIDAIDPTRLRDVLVSEMQRGLRLSTAGAVLRARSEGPRASFLANELQALHERTVHRVLKILALSYDPKRIEAVAEALVSDNPARRSNALELLEGTLSKVAATPVMPFFEVVSEGMPLHRVVELLEDAGAIQRQPAEALLHEPEWWPRALALHILHRDDEITTPGQAPGGAPTVDGMIPLIEKVMLLKGSEFFRHFPGGDLGGIAALTEVVHVQADETIFEQGDEGDAFYVVVSGAIVISRGATKLATLGPREGFGEMSILDRETRSATATATEDTTLLSLDRDSFDRIIEQNPVVARGVYRVLTERLRNTLAQVASG